jgi:hypothetical protein
MKTNFSLKTAQAADVAGVGYEGFRTWLKRGLLKANGILPKFYALDVPADIADAKRWRWTAFGYADLCSFRLTKILLDSGLPWEAASSIVSDNTLWKSHQSNDDTIQYLVIGYQGADYYLCDREELANSFTAGTIEKPIMTLIDLDHLRRDVVFRCRTAALRAVAADLKQTSHISVRSGPNPLTPQEAAERKQEIEGLADKIDALAASPAPGSKAYGEYETIRHQLQKLGKFPESSAVSAVAASFTLRHGA